jgi:hypothetical protein
MKILRILVVILVLLPALAACSMETETPTPQASIEVIDLQIIPELGHWMPAISDCANQIPYFTITVQATPQSAMGIDQADLIIRLGDRTTEDPFVTVLGVEDLVILAGNSVQISSIGIESLRSIYLGEINNWDDVPEVSADDLPANQPILAFTNLDGTSLRTLFEESYLNGQPINDQAIIFSTLSSTIDFLRETPYAIGYMLKSQVPLGIKILPVTDFPTEANKQYVLAVTPHEPEGQLRQFLLCLQEN